MLKSILFSSILVCCLLFLGCTQEQEPTSGEVFKSSSAWATNADLKLATKQAVEEAVSKLNDQPKLAIIAHTYMKNGSQVSATAEKLLSDDTTIIVLETSWGVISNKNYSKENAVSVLLMSGDFSIKTSSKQGLEDSDEALSKAALQMANELADPRQALIFLFSDPAVTHGKADFMLSFMQVLTDNSANTSLIGGNAARTGSEGELFLNGKLLSNGLVGVSIIGDLYAGIGTATHVLPVKGPYKVTKTLPLRGIAELDNKPVSQVFEEATGKELTGGQVIGLNRGEEMRARYAWFDKENKALYRLPDQISIGDEVFFIDRNDKTSIKKSAEKAVKMATKNMSIINQDAKPAMVFMSNCIGRVGVNAMQDTINASNEILGELPLFGFYAAGEFATIDQHKPSERPYYNQTTTCILVLGQ